MTAPEPVTSTSRRPRPLIDEQSAPYWEHCARHELAIARCGQCGQLSHPPDIICPNCLNTDPRWTFTRVSGDGAIRSWTVVRRSFLRGFEAPFVLVDVELREPAAVRLIGRLLADPETPLTLGMAVTTTFEDIGGGLAVPAFVLAATP